ncbi:class I adenylate-forming enzyme family protein [Actinophytocola gossypii]|uniref:Acyl--CoA ligase n=1 Tax=Actinophytocola gossypii TaxID=2812003 RepID=A0ABT2JCW0_9PSEU|nr:class I adenylate-forming enzyme family protein [Actinophytocola gossypii]MCT2585551.1 acyl--CoA ligase [Actinophytocola gossypii]
MGVLFDECADRDQATTIHLDRPFDIAPESGVDHDLPGLARLVWTTAGWLAAAGVRRGDRVAIVKDNHWDYDLLACAAVRIGAVPAKLSGHLPPESLAVLLRRVGPAVLVTTAGVLTAGRDAGVDLTTLARTTVDLNGTDPSALSVPDLLGHGTPPPVRPRDDDPLVVMHTSGTTGLPKLVVHSTATIIGALAQLEARRIPVIGVRGTDTLANASAYSHGRTFCWTASALALAPSRIVVLTRDDPDLADPVLRNHPPTVVEALPATYVRLRPLTTRLDNAFRAVRLFMSTYDAIHPPVVRAYLDASARRRPLWMQGWGQSETGPITFRFLDRRVTAPRDLGRPIPLRTRLRVVDPATLTPVGRGEPGLVQVRTPARCLGYLGEDERFAAKSDGGWWNTGDLAVRGRTGRVRLLDREVDLAPGMSCLAAEDTIEDRLDAVVECVLLGVSGRPPVPVVVTADGTLDQRAWTRAVADLPPLADPVVRTWDQLPRTGTGKVRRHDLLTALAADATPAGSGRWT